MVLTEYFKKLKVIFQNDVISAISSEFLIYKKIFPPAHSMATANPNKSEELVTNILTCSHKKTKLQIYHSMATVWPQPI